MAEAEATAEATVELIKVMAVVGDADDVGIDDNVVDDVKEVVNVDIDVDNHII